MFVVTIDSDECGGCGECVGTCPSQMIVMIEGKAQVAGDSSECLGCESCVVVCANECVTVEEY